MRKKVEFICPDGSRGDGYLSMAADPRAGVIVLQEWWGLNDQILAVADRFAAAGYAALVPDLYRGRVTDDANEANHIMTGLDWVGAVEVEVRGALNYLKGIVPRVAVSGFCMGGALSIIAGAKLAECDAVVCFYGIPPAEQADARTLKVPFLGHFATRDKWYPPETVDGLATALAASASPHEIYNYDAEHAFFNETGPAYDANAAEAAWARTQTFLQARL